MKIATCHPDRRHYSKNLCKSCYHREFRKTNKPKTKATCHPERAHKCKGLCNPCYQKYRASEEFNPTGRSKTPITCGHPDKKHVGHGLCGGCFTRWRREQDPSDKARRKDYQLRATYGISLEQFHAMYEAQGCACALCRKPIAIERHRHVDHCHDTGRVRGILCFDCNKGLGMLGDSPEALRRAFEYVSRCRLLRLPVREAA